MKRTIVEAYNKVILGSQKKYSMTLQGPKKNSRKNLMLELKFKGEFEKNIFLPLFLLFSIRADFLGYL